MNRLTTNVGRLHKVLLIVTFLPLCWLTMMAVHELGHVLGACVSGGTVSKVVLYPLAISRTDLGENPHPLFVVWTGPIVGVLLPLAAAGLFRIAKLPWWYLLQFFAGFCLIANGAYIGVGSFQRIGDAGEMLGNGSPIWGLWAFGVVTVPLGLLLWNGLGTHFGLGKRNVDSGPAYISAGLLLLTLIVEFLLSPR